ncbi:chemokine vCXCL8 [Cercopithecine betaherpesvirus 5]|uniref:Chemokine vCXCL8 n=1 Tax=Simian cytomegalovirus (strain Colburn) TaxID=50292 RepID=G8XU23_SCMVC|nr:chemokine vCXCL8 [Cercopithecine betaherpesvirus 5]
MNVMWNPRFLAVALLLVSLIAYSESQGIHCECKKGERKIPEDKIVVKRMKKPSGPNPPRGKVTNSTQPVRDAMGRPVLISS